MQHLQPHDFVGRSLPRSSFYDSPFGRMFGRLPPWVPPGDDDAAKERYLEEFASTNMVEPADAMTLDNTEIPAGYTYLGQFVDHDITFDPTSSTTRLNDPNKLKNFRTPRFDLDSVYGSGPDAAPYLYDRDDYGMFLLGTGESGKEADLLRNRAGTALIGDPRNDENLIIAQIQLVFLQLHNAVLSTVRRISPTTSPTDQFHEAQRICRWFYQYVVWHDFIKRLVYDDLHHHALAQTSDAVSRSKSTITWSARKRYYSWKQAPYIPVEFSAAAYRFGHSMVRPGYLVNRGIGDETELPIFAPLDATGRPTTPDLRGGRPLPSGHTLRWDWFFEFPSSEAGQPQASRKIDTLLSPAMSNIPTGPNKTVPLAFLNLRRGWRMELPSGPDVATFLGIPDDQRPTIAPGTAEESLWYYILAEPKHLGRMSGKMLGPVGGTIVAEVFAGLLDGDPLSFINLDPLWNPGSEEALRQLGVHDSTDDSARWTFSDLLVAAGRQGDTDVDPTIVIDLTDPALVS